MHFTYRTKGTCSQEILFDVDGKTVKNNSQQEKKSCCKTSIISQKTLLSQNRKHGKSSRYLKPATQTSEKIQEKSASRQSPEKQTAGTFSKSEAGDQKSKASQHKLNSKSFQTLKKKSRYILCIRTEKTAKKQAGSGRDSKHGKLVQHQ